MPTPLYFIGIDIVLSKLPVNCRQISLLPIFVMEQAELSLTWAMNLVNLGDRITCLVLIRETVLSDFDVHPQVGDQEGAEEKLELLVPDQIHELFVLNLGRDFGVCRPEYPLRKSEKIRHPDEQVIFHPVFSEFQRIITFHTAHPMTAAYLQAAYL